MSPKSREITMLRADDGALVRPWTYRAKGWQFSADSETWINDHSQFNPPSAYCLGERYIACQYGLDSFGILWTGSTPDNWHGWSFGIELGEAIRWVRDAAQADLGCAVWGFPK